MKILYAIPSAILLLLIAVEAFQYSNSVLTITSRSCHFLCRRNAITCLQSLTKKSPFISPPFHECGRHDRRNNGKLFGAKKVKQDGSNNLPPSYSSDLESVHQPQDSKRRKALLDMAAFNTLPFLTSGHAHNANAAGANVVMASEKEQSFMPIADLPMRRDRTFDICVTKEHFTSVIFILSAQMSLTTLNTVCGLCYHYLVTFDQRLQLPKGGLGREYIIIQLYIQGKGPFDFMVDSGLTTELITPHLKQILSIDKASGITKQGLSAGAIQSQSLVELTDVSLCCGNFYGNDNENQQYFQLPSPLTAIVTDFPQEHIDPQHDPVEGMIGMELLEMFDVDLDFPANRLRLWKPGTAAKSLGLKAGQASTANLSMVNVPAIVINETRLLGFRVVPSSSGKDNANEVTSQPFLGVVDCGASFSVVNWAAAPLLGLPPKNSDQYKRSPAVTGVGVDGRPQLLPTAKIGLSYCGDPVPTAGGAPQQGFVFEPPPSYFKSWDPTSIAIGDLPVFSQLLGDGRSEYRGPAGIIGLDILSQRRVILETGVGRRRRIFIGAS